jgi:hypothetical protein
MLRVRREYKQKKNTIEHKSSPDEKNKALSNNFTVSSLSKRTSCLCALLFLSSALLFWFDLEVTLPNVTKWKEDPVNPSKQQMYQTNNTDTKIVQRDFETPTGQASQADFVTEWKEDPVNPSKQQMYQTNNTDTNNVQRDFETPTGKGSQADLPPATVKHSDIIMQNDEWMNAIVVEEYKLIYFPMPKVGSSGWRLMFRRMMGLVEGRSDSFVVFLSEYSA